MIDANTTHQSETSPQKDTVRNPIDAKYTDVIRRYLASGVQFCSLARSIHDAAKPTHIAHDSNVWDSTTVIHHLADMDIVGALRMRIAIANSGASISSVDQDVWASALPHDRSVESSLSLIDSCRNANAAILTELSVAQWERFVVHDVSGAVSVFELVESATQHALEHSNTLTTQWYRKFR
jgi:hypothetical protein